VNNITPDTIRNWKETRRRISALTAYDFPTARLLDEAGIDLLLVGDSLGMKITQSVTIPTIGIGAGPDTSGQVLVCQDVLGLSYGFKPKFLRTYANIFETIRHAPTSTRANARAITCVALRRSSSTSFSSARWPLASS